MTTMTPCNGSPNGDQRSHPVWQGAAASVRRRRIGIKTHLRACVDLKMAKGKCPVCGTTVNRILGKA